MYLRSLLAIFVLIFSPLTFADNELVPYSPINGSFWYLGLGNISFDSKVSAQEFIEDSSFYLRVGIEKVNSSLIYGGGISGYFYRDNSSFSQQVIDQFGNVSTADSTADSFNLYGEVGYAYPLSQSVYIDFLGGYEHVIQSSRSIGNCSDCAKQDIEIDAGLYINPRIRFQSEAKFMMQFSYQLYTGGDTENAISLYFGSKF